jgi:hypothetical protein
MADNSLRTPGSGESIASNDIGGTKFQRMKKALGAAGLFTGDEAAASELGDAEAGTKFASAGVMVWNGSAFEREHSNLEGTLLASAARTATTSTAVQTNRCANSVIVVLNVSAVGGAVSLVVRFYGGIAGAANEIYLNAAPTAVTGTTNTAYVLGLGAAGTFSPYVTQSTSMPLPRTWGVDVVHGNGVSATYSLHYILIL